MLYIFASVDEVLLGKRYVPTLRSILRDLDGDLAGEDVLYPVAVGSHPTLSLRIPLPFSRTGDPAQHHSVPDLLAHKINSEGPLDTRQVEDSIVDVESLTPEVLEELGEEVPVEKRDVEIIDLPVAGKLQEADFTFDKGERLLTVQRERPRAPHSLYVERDLGESPNPLADLVYILV